MKKLPKLLKVPLNSSKLKGLYRKLKDSKLLQNPLKSFIFGLAIILGLGLAILYTTPHAPRLTKAPKDSGFLYAASNDTYDLKLGAKDTNQPKVEFTVAGSTATFIPQDADLASIQSSKKGKTATFASVYPNVDLTYQTLENGVKEEIILNSPQEKTDFTFRMNLQGSENNPLTTNFPSPVFYDSEGSYVFHFQEPFAVDAAGNRTDNVNLQVKSLEAEGEYFIRVSVDPNWLSSEDRIYPISIDPSVVHDDEFATGTFNRAKNIGGPQIETYYQELPADENTVGLWHMNEGSDNTCSGGEDICDESSNAFDGTFVGTAAFNGSGKLGDDAITLDGNSDYATTAEGATYSTDVFSISAWIYRDTDSGGNEFIIDNRDSTAVGWLAFINASDVLECLRNASTTTSTTTINTGEWYHISCVSDDTNINAYVNGVLEGTTAISGSISETTNARIGARSFTSAASYFPGKLDEIRVSNIARTPEEIKAAAQRRPYSIYTSPVLDLGADVTSWKNLSWTENGVTTDDGETIVDSTGLIAQWNFNETSGTTANNDAEGTSCNGTPANCDGALVNIDDTTGQDTDPDSSWTANNRRWGAGAIQFDGVNSRVSCSEANCGGTAKLDFANADAITLTAWFKTSKTTGTQVIMGKKNNTGAANDGYQMIITTPYTLRCRFSDGTNQVAPASKTIVTDGQWHFGACTSDGTDAKIYVDGVLETTTSITAVSGSLNNAETFRIGAQANNDRYFDGPIDSPAVYRRTLGATEILSLYNKGNVEFETRVGNDSSPNDGSWEAWKPTTSESQLDALDSGQYDTSDSAMVSYWKMDGDATDSDDNNDGSVSGAVNVSDGRFGSAYQFDGADDVITITQASNINLTSKTAYTLEAWFLADTDGEGSTGQIVQKGTNTFIRVDTQGSDGTLDIEASLDLATPATLNLANAARLGQWTHVALVYTDDSDDEITLYVNGIDMGSSTDGVGSPTTDSNNLLIGGTTTANFDGLIDEVAIWNDARTGAEVAQDAYWAPSILNMASAGGISTSTDSTIYHEGSGAERFTTGKTLVDTNTAALWHLDETNGDNAGSDIFDETANNNDGEFVGSNIATGVVDGISGKARTFNNSDDYIDVGDIGSTEGTTYTISGWAKTDTGAANPALYSEGTPANWTNNLLILYYGDTGGASGGLRVWYMDSGGVGGSIITYSTSVVDNKWHHIALVQNSAADRKLYLDGVQVGSDTTSRNALAVTDASLGAADNNGTMTQFFNGEIDEFQISDVARTTEEIAEAYRLGRDHYLNRTISSTDLSGKTKVPFYIAADRPGTYLETTIGESEFANYQPDTNTLGLWHFDEGTPNACNTGTNDVCDSSKSGRHGNETSAPPVVQGIRGKARDFDGSADYITITNEGSVFSIDNYTISAWIYRDTDSGTSERIIDNRDSADVGTSLWISSTDILTCTYNAIDVVSVFTISLDAWHHVVCTADGSNVKLYIDGELEASQTQTGSISESTAMKIGTRNFSTASFFFPGIIDEVRVDNTARTADQIRQAHEVGRRSHPITIDFAASLDSGNVIDSSTDTTFTVDATSFGLEDKGDQLFPEDKIIIKETVDATTYIAQGDITKVHTSTGSVSISSWDSGSTFPSGGFTSNASVFKWQREYWDISEITLDSHRDAITNLTLRVTDGNEGRTVWIDDLREGGAYLTTNTDSTITSSTGKQYLQYRAVISSSDEAVSANLSQVTVDYKTAAPTAWWKFDEAVDDTCSGGTNDTCDSSENGNDGAMTGGTWSTQDLCVTGNCMFFDGTDDVSTITNAVTIDMDDELAAGLTYQAWVRVNSDGEGSVGEIFDKGTTTYLRVTSEGADGLADLEASLDLATTPATLTVTNGIILDTWHHVAMVYTDDDDDEITIYIDGVSQGSSTDGDGAPAADANNLLIGGSSSANFHGFIDSFKIFSVERTAAQITTDILSDTSPQGSSAVLGARDYGFLNDGLVGYWNMDEVGDSDNVIDYSGNGFTGTPTGQTAVNGKFGNARQNDNVTLSRIDVGDQAELELTEFTAAAWIYKNGVCNAFNACSIISKGMTASSGFSMVIDDTTDLLELSIKDGNQRVIGTTTFQDNQWYHVAASLDGSRVKVYVNGKLETNEVQTATPNYLNEPFLIGNANTNQDLPFNGIIDEARFYNRALTPSEVEGLYNWAPGPVGYWPMDENTGTTTTYDHSGNGNNGTLTSITESSWVPGRLGSALDFDGGADYITVSDATPIDIQNAITISSWVYIDDFGADSFIITKRTLDTTEANYFLRIDAVSNNLLFGLYDGSWQSKESVQTLTSGAWHHVAITYDEANIIFYIDGVAEAAQAFTATLIPNDADLKIGRANSTPLPRYWDGRLDDIRLYNYDRTPGQIIEDMNAGHPLGGSPIGSQVLYWNFDEQSGQTANDKGASSNNGTLGATESVGSDDPTWKLETDCKINGCLSFDGSNDHVLNTAPSGLPNGDVSKSMTAWFKTTDSTNQNNIGGFGNAADGANFQIATDSDAGTGTWIVFGWSPSKDWNTGISNNNYTDGLWHHVTVTYDTTTTKVYFDGVEQANTTSYSWNTDPQTVVLGLEIDLTGHDYNGFIDEFKIYSTALTESEILVDMNAGSSAAFGGVLGSSEAADLTDGAGNPPVGYWPIDENTGTTTTVDKSGNGNDGTLTSITESSWVPGKHGSALNLDGSADYINPGDIAIIDSATALSACAWVKHDTLTTDDSIVSKYVSDDGFQLVRDDVGSDSGRTDTYKIYVAGSASSNSALIEGAENASVADTWTHVCFTFTTGSSTGLRLYINGVEDAQSPADTSLLSAIDAGATNLNIGRNPSGAIPFDGAIDDVKIYDYVRTQAQIAYDYNRGRPVGWWKLDECTGTTAYDSSGNSNNGTITAGDTSGSNDSVGTCSSGAGDEMWDNGTTGKLNYSLDFDGTNDYVDMGDPSDGSLDFGTSNFTTAAWIKSSTAATQFFLQKGATAVATEGYSTQLGSGGQIISRICDGTNRPTVSSTNVTLNDGVWHHIATVYNRDNNTAYLYVDGHLNNSADISSISGNSIDSTQDFYISRITANGDLFDGQIDDVRLYNYALSQTQIRKIMQESAQRFGPATGHP